MPRKGVCFRCGKYLADIDRHLSRTNVCEPILSNFTYDQLRENMKYMDDKVCTRCGKKYAYVSYDYASLTNPFPDLESHRTICNSCAPSALEESIKDRLEIAMEILLSLDKNIAPKRSDQSSQDYLKQVVDNCGKCSNYESCYKSLTKIMELRKRGSYNIFEEEACYEELKKYLKY